VRVPGAKPARPCAGTAHSAFGLDHSSRKEHVCANGDRRGGRSALVSAQMKSERHIGKITLKPLLRPHQFLVNPREIVLYHGIEMIDTPVIAGMEECFNLSNLPQVMNYRCFQPWLLALVGSRSSSRSSCIKPCKSAMASHKLRRDSASLNRAVFSDSSARKTSLKVTWLAAA
jgi:hypothetical protein